MSTYETIKTLCKERGIAVTALEKELGFGRGSIGKLRNSQTSAERLQKIADYFNVTVDYLVKTKLFFQVGLIDSTCITERNYAVKNKRVKRRRLNFCCTIDKVIHCNIEIVCYFLKSFS